MPDVLSTRSGATAGTIRIGDDLRSLLRPEHAPHGSRAAPSEQEALFSESVRTPFFCARETGKAPNVKLFMLIKWLINADGSVTDLGSVFEGDISCDPSSDL